MCQIGNVLSKKYRNLVIRLYMCNITGSKNTTTDTNTWNVHRMFILIYRNPQTQNWFRYETFIHHFEFKGYSTWGKRDTIFLCWLLLHRQLSTQPTCSARSAQIRLASPSSESRLSRSEERTQLTAFSQISAHTSGGWHHSHPLVINSYLGFLFWHLWMTHPLRAPVSTWVNVAPN